MDDRAQLQLKHRKLRDQSIALLFVGIIVLMPPIAALSLLDVDVAGLPLPIDYLFSVWLLLIVGAYALSRRLLEGDDVMASNETLDDQN